VKVIFEPNFEKRLTNLAHVSASTQPELNSAEFFTTASQSFLPQLSFTNEEEGSNSGMVANTHNNTLLPSTLNISNISFNEPSSPINETK
jgi:hypothetical protein